MSDIHKIGFFKLDLTKLENAPEIGVLLPLLSAYNDIINAQALAALVVREKNSYNTQADYTNDLFFDGLIWMLFKQQVSVAADAIKNTVQDVRKAEIFKGMNELWSLIRSSALLEASYQKVSTYLPPVSSSNPPISGGQNYSILEKQLHVRDKMNSHHDQKPLLDAFFKVNKYLRDHGRSAEGWIQSCETAPYSRYHFIDNLQSIAWYSKNEIELNPLGYDVEPNSIAASDDTREMLKALIEFILQLEAAVAEKYSLRLPVTQPEWIP